MIRRWLQRRREAQWKREREAFAALCEAARRANEASQQAMNAEIEGSMRRKIRGLEAWLPEQPEDPNNPFFGGIGDRMK